MPFEQDKATRVQAIYRGRRRRMGAWKVQNARGGLAPSTHAQSPPSPPHLPPQVQMYTAPLIEPTPAKLKEPPLLIDPVAPAPFSSASLFNQLTGIPKGASSSNGMSSLAPPSSRRGTARRRRLSSSSANGGEGQPAGDTKERREDEEPLEGTSGACPIS